MNWKIALVAFLWYVGENNYFGWNKTPHSDVELIADGICFVIVALSFIQISGSNVKINVNPPQATD